MIDTFIAYGKDKLSIILTCIWYKNNAKININNTAYNIF